MRNRNKFQQSLRRTVDHSPVGAASTSHGFTQHPGLSPGRRRRSWDSTPTTSLLPLRQLLTSVNTWDFAFRFCLGALLFWDKGSLSPNLTCLTSDPNGTFFFPAQVGLVFNCPPALHHAVLRVSRASHRRAPPRPQPHLSPLPPRGGSPEGPLEGSCLPASEQWGGGWLREAHRENALSVPSPRTLTFTLCQAGNNNHINSAPQPCAPHPHPHPPPRPAGRGRRKSPAQAGKQSPLCWQTWASGQVPAAPAMESAGPSKGVPWAAWAVPQSPAQFPTLGGGSDPWNSGLKAPRCASVSVRPNTPPCAPRAGTPTSPQLRVCPVPQPCAAQEAER